MYPGGQPLNLDLVHPPVLLGLPQLLVLLVEQLLRGLHEDSALWK